MKRTGYIPATLSAFFLLGCGAPVPLEENGARQASSEFAPATCEAQAGRPVVIGGDTVLLPYCGPPRERALGSNGRHVVFANFEGVDVRPGNSSLDNSAIRDNGNKGVIPTEPYAPDDPDRDDKILKIQKQVAAWYADFNVDIVISRPLTGDYMMTAVGDHQSKLGFDSNTLGISPGDCKNVIETDVNWAFTAFSTEGYTQHDVHVSSIVVAHEAGHALGLGHVKSEDDIMFPTAAPQSNPQGFVGGKVADPGPCRAKDGDYQDSHRVLLENLGARPPEDERPGQSAPPVVRILTPEENTTVGRDLTIAVLASAQAKGGIDRVTLSVSRAEDDKFRGNHPVAELRPPNAAAAIRLSIPGHYQVTATAYDKFGNVALTRRRFNVSTITCGEPNDCTPGQRCINNTCVTMPLPEKSPTGSQTEPVARDWGTTCEQSSECEGGICAITPVGQICTHYCNSTRSCVPGLKCSDGICLPPLYSSEAPKIGQLGSKCMRKEDCFTGECSPLVNTTTTRYCTKSCDPELAWSCPSNMACSLADTALGMRTICVIKPIGQMAEGHGCELSHRRSLQAGTGCAVLIFLIGGMALVRRRRFRYS